jgi:hypothetical protein
LLVLVDIAGRSLARRQFYVANTRYRGAHRIYVSNREQILARLAQRDEGRELATEFIARRRISMRELMSFRRLPRMLENLRLSIMAALEERRRMRETMSQGREV